MQTWTVSSLLGACASGSDPRSWEEFIRRFESAICHGLRRAQRRAAYWIDPEALDDLRQDVYCRLVEDGARVLANCRASTEAEVAAYLAKIAENVTLDHLRAGSARKRGGGRRETSIDEPGLNLANGSVGREPTPEERLLAEEDLRRFSRSCRRAVSRSAVERDWRILQLALIGGYSSAEIAGLLGSGLSTSGIDSIVCRVKRRLRAQGIAVAARR